MAGDPCDEMVVPSADAFPVHYHNQPAVVVVVAELVSSLCVANAASDNLIVAANSARPDSAAPVAVAELVVVARVRSLYY